MIKRSKKRGEKKDEERKIEEVTSKIFLSVALLYFNYSLHYCH